VEVRSVLEVIGPDGNPINNTDPMGLSFASDFLSGSTELAGDYGDRLQEAMARRAARMTRHTIPAWAHIDAIIMQHQASKAAVLASLGKGIEAAEFLIITAANVAPGIGQALSAHRLITGQGDWTDVAGLVPVGAAAAKGSKIFWKVLGSVVSWFAENRAASGIASAIGSGFHKVQQALARGISRAAKAIGCLHSFTGETLIITKDGEIPIELVRPGDFVLARCQWDSSAAPDWRPVTHVFCHGPKPVMTVLFGSGEAFTVTLDHEIWVETRGWLLSRDLSPGMLVRLSDGGLAAVDSVWIEPQPRRVYNLEVDDAHTFFASGVWVHNTCKWQVGTFGSLGRCREMHRHHGLLDRWARANVPGYSRSAAPAMAVPRELHMAANRIQNSMMSKYRISGNKVDWTKIPPTRN
jgi:hypothetical protein